MTSDSSYYETTTPPRTFRLHMKLLAEAGYSAVPISEALEKMEVSDFKPCVAITFDDGYRNVLTEAWPVMADYGFRATIYAIAGNTKAESSFKARECLSEREMASLLENGNEVGSHTVTHPQLHDIPWSEVEHEIRDSKKMLEDKLATEVNSFCYPYAFPETDKTFVSRLGELLAHCGYKNSVTTVIGTATPATGNVFLPRLPINGWDDPVLFDAKIRGAYDWMHTPQFVFKRVKHLLSTATLLG